MPSQVQPVVPVAGRVVAERVVVVPPLDATETRPARAEFSFREVDVLVEAALGDEVQPELRAPLTCTTDADSKVGTVGEVVDWSCFPYATAQARRGGGYFNVVRFRVIADRVGAAAESASPLRAVAGKS